MSNKTIVQLLEENELNVSTLYALYAKKIPSKSAFWGKLSQEEIFHAESIKKDGKENDLANSIIENNFSRGIIKYVSDFVLKEIQKAEEKESLSHSEALQTALRIEQSLLEKKCFDIFAPTNTTLKDLFKKLNADTQKHTQLLIKELEKSQG